MKRQSQSRLFVYKIILCITIILLAYGLLVFSFYGNKHSGSWVNSYLLKKNEYANKDDRKKIVLIGGSNVLFGISAERIEEEFNIKTVNFGLTAGLKTDYYLHIAKKVAKPNDIIIAPFEYENYTWDNEPITTRQLFLFSYDKKYLLNQGFVSLFKEIYKVSIVDFLGNIYKDNVLYKDFEINQNYKNLTINENGDINFTGSSSESLKRIDLQFDINDGFRETYALRKIKEFNSYAKIHNIKFYVSYPNIVKHRDYFSAKYTSFFKDLKHYFISNGIEVIGSPEAYMFDYKYTYDARYHLNESGIKKRTDSFIKHLKEMNIK